MCHKLNKSLTLKSGKTCTCCEDALREVSEVLFENSGHSMNIALLQKLLSLVRIALISSLLIKSISTLIVVTIKMYLTLSLVSIDFVEMVLEV